MIAGICLMADGRKSGLLVGLLGACCSHIGRPAGSARSRPFLPANRSEWIMVLSLVATVAVVAYFLLPAVPPPDAVTEPHPPLSPFAASVAVLISVVVIGAKFLREKRSSQANATGHPGARPESE